MSGAKRRATDRKELAAGESVAGASPELIEAYNRALLDHLLDVETRMLELEQKLQQTEHAVQQTTPDPRVAPKPAPTSLPPELQDFKQLVQRIEDARVRAESMRIDRQLKRSGRFVGRLLNARLASMNLGTGERKRQRRRAKDAKRIDRMMTMKYDLLIVCPIYPGGARAYGGEFIERRVAQYLERGVSVGVIECSPSTKALTRHTHRGVDVLRVNPAGAAKALRLSEFKKIAAHQLERPTWQQIKGFTKSADVTVFIHGYEARNWRELSFNFDKEHLDANFERLERANADRRSVMREIFADESINKVFVSDHMRSVAARFVDLKPTPSSVIHNCVSHRDFPYIEKTAEHRYKILWIRSFSAKNYANDLSSEFVQALMQRPYADKLSVSIFGDGPDFDRYTSPLTKYSNVTIERRFLTLEDVREQHARHGVILVPSRWDSQGLTCGEGMSSGLVPLTNKVAALPEFVDTACGVLAEPDSFEAFVEAMDLFDAHPEIYLQMSKNAAQRSQWQCGEYATVERELGLLDPKSETFPPIRRMPSYMAKSAPYGLPANVDAIRA